MYAGRFLLSSSLKSNPKTLDATHCIHILIVLNNAAFTM